MTLSLTPLGPTVLEPDLLMGEEEPWCYLCYTYQQNVPAVSTFQLFIIRISIDDPKPTLT